LYHDEKRATKFRYLEGLQAKVEESDEAPPLAVPSPPSLWGRGCPTGRERACTLQGGGTARCQGFSGKVAVCKDKQRRFVWKGFSSILDRLQSVSAAFKNAEDKRYFAKIGKKRNFHFLTLSQKRKTNDAADNLQGSDTDMAAGRASSPLAGAVGLRRRQVDGA
jgi:hypothetical protein